MCLFGLFKKSSGSESSAEARCEYCEFGKPAKSAGKILCTKCGLVSADSGCKKFRYSITKYTETLKRAEQKTEAGAVSVPSEVSAPASDPESPANAQKEQSSEKIQPSETIKPEQTTSETAADHAEAFESAGASDVSVPQISDIKIPFERIVHVPDASIPQVSGIKNEATDNSEKIRKLYQTELPSTDVINIEAEKKEIILPDVSENAVSGITSSAKPHESAEKRLAYVNIPTISNIE
ncbi:MAG: hypothetical protein ACI4I9_07160 [Porcipelethomonas sp.]